MQGEVEFFQGAFESYKTQLHQEIEDKWQKREDDMKMSHQEELQRRLHETSM